MLASCLTRHDDVPSALHAYDERRVPRTSTLVKRSHAVARVGRFKNPLICALRDRATSLTLGGPGFKDYRKLAAETMDGVTGGDSDPAEPGEDGRPHTTLEAADDAG